MTALVRLRSIGHIETDATEDEIRKNRRNLVSRVIIDEDFSDGLVGLEGYSHLFVIYWMHKVPEIETKALKVHPRHSSHTPLVGVFATRGRTHPNKMGLSVTQLLGVEKNVLSVKGLDAVAGTPVLDIKPYDHYDVFETIVVPGWWLKLTEQRNNRFHAD